MPEQKGSLLDKIKAFFVRRRKNKLKKKEQERKELEEVLKNISEKVIPLGTPVNVGVAVDKINLNKISLRTNKNVVTVMKPRILEPQEEKETKKKNLTKQEIAEETIATMSATDLLQLRKRIVENSKVVVGVAPVIQNQIPQKQKESEPFQQTKEVVQDNIAVKKDVKKQTSQDISSTISVTQKHVQPEQKETGYLHQPQKVVQNNIGVKNGIKIETSKNAQNTILEPIKVNISPAKSQENSKTEKQVEQEKISTKPQFQPKKTNKGMLVKKVKSSNIRIINLNNKAIKPKHGNIKLKQAAEQKIMQQEKEISLILMRMIDRNLYELAYFKEELTDLTDKTKEAKTKEEIEEIEKRFLILKERLELVYNDFLDLRQKASSAEIPNEYNESFSELLNKYKLDIKSDESIEQLLKGMDTKFKENLNIMESIVCLEESKEILGDEIYTKKEDIRVRDEELERSDETLQKIDFIKNELDQTLESNKIAIVNVIEHVNSIRPEERVQYQFHVAENLMRTALNFGAAFALLNPNNGRLSNAYGAVTMLNAVRSIGRIFEPERQVYYVSSNDFENEILEHLNDYTYINRNLDLSIEEIEKLKEDFDDKYIQYIDDIPEIGESYRQINDLQDQLKDIKVEMRLQEAVLERQIVKNNQIVKSIEG